MRAAVRALAMLRGDADLRAGLPPRAAPTPPRATACRARRRARATRRSTRPVGARASRETCRCSARACRCRSPRRSAGRPRASRSTARLGAPAASSGRAARGNRSTWSRERARRGGRSPTAARSRCSSPAVAIVEAGQSACVAPEAACPRGTRAAAAAPADGLSRRTCDRPLACPPGSLADGSTCRPVVTAGGRAGSRVDVGAWAALALGIHGGPGSAALCRPLAQRPDVFERSSAAWPDGDGAEPAASATGPMAAPTAGRRA